MSSSFNRPLAVRNTVLTLILAALLEVGVRLFYEGPTSDFFAVKRILGFLILGWVIVDFFELGTVRFPRKHVAEEVPGENQSTPL